MPLTFPNPRHKRSPRNQIINNAFPDWLDNDGVISQLNSPPWAQYVENYGINIAYHTHSGEKFISPVMYNFLDENGEISSTGKQALSRTLQALYYNKWQHLWDAYNIQYNPAHSFQSTETRQLSSQKQGTQSSTRTPNLTDITTYNTAIEHEINVTNTPRETTTTSTTRTPQITSTTTYNTEDEDTLSSTSTVDYGKIDTTVTDNDVQVSYGKEINEQTNVSNNLEHLVYGFNASNAVPASKDLETKFNGTTTLTDGSDTTATDETKTSTLSGEDETTVSSTNTNTKTGTETQQETGSESIQSTETKGGTNTAQSSDTATNTGTDTVQRTGTEALTGATSDSELATETITKSGNQQPIAELLSIDRDYWLTDYFDIVFNDIDKFIALAVYSSAPIKQTYLGG